MVFAAVTDLHITNDNGELVLPVWEKFLEECQENDVERIFVLGDTFTSRKGQGIGAMVNFLRLQELIVDYGYENQVFFITGNHDKTDQEDELSYLTFLAQDCITIYEKGHIRTFGDLGFAFLSYFKENGSYSERLRNLIKECKEHKGINKWILLTHIAVNGVKNNDGSEVTTGVGVKAFQYFDKVLVGHYHNESSFKNIFYIGSMQPQNFGENNKKGFTLIDGEGNLTKKTLDFPKFLKVNFDMETNYEKKLESMIRKHSNSSHFVRFIFQGTEEQLSLISKERFEKVGIDVKKENKNIIKNIDMIENVADLKVTFDDESLGDEFIEYCKKNEEIDGDLFDLGLDLFQHAIL